MGFPRHQKADTMAPIKMVEVIKRGKTVWLVTNSKPLTAGRHDLKCFASFDEAEGHRTSLNIRRWSWAFPNSF
jgi:hypothetical protein